MSAPYVCPSCRHNVARHLRRLPHTSRATFISFNSNNPRQTPAKENTPNPENSKDAQQSKTKTPSSSNPSRTDALSNLFGVIGTSNRYSRPHAIDQGPDELPQALQPQRAQAPQPKASQTVPVASELRKILENPAKTTKDAWEYFERHYTSPDCPPLKSPSLLDVRELVSGEQFNKLQWDILRDWYAGKSDASLPTPIELAQKYVYLGIMKPEFWHPVLWSLNTRALKKLQPGATETSRRSASEMMAQIIRIWDLLLKTCSNAEGSTGVQSPAPMWSSLPPWATVRQITRPFRFFGTRLNQFIPAMEAKIANRIAYSALITFDILTRDNINLILDKKIVSDSEPFIVFVAHLIPGSIRLPVKQYDDSPNVMLKLLESAQVSSEAINALSNRVLNSVSKCMKIVGSVAHSAGSSGPSASIEEETRGPDQSLEDFCYARIARAYSQGKRFVIYDLWVEACEALSQENNETKAPPVPSALYDLTLEALMAMRLPDQAIKVWNQMVESGIKPTIKTWTAMINGCGKAKDFEGLEQMWARMLNSGVQPDVHAWSARISGIMRSGKFTYGLAALDEMGKIWVDAYKRLKSPSKRKKSQAEPDPAMLPAKPSTVILNGTITAMAQSQGRNQQYLARILAWARSFGIDPDVFTYNSLIAMSLSAGNGEEAMKLLQQMDKANIQPDAATFAIILNSIFRSETTAKMSPEEQNEKVMGVLRNLEAHGLTATPHIYSTLVDGLLRRHGNVAAAKAVLDYMVAKKVDIPPHIFTVLMAHYFAHYEFEAIEQLWKQIKVSGVVVDTIFYDRMIERYAAVGDIPKMLSFLKRMSNEGLTPGWPALQQVVVKLAEAGEWTKFEEIVNDVEQGVGIAQKGMRVSEDNVISNFWKAVAWKRAEKPKPGDPELSFMQQTQHKI